MNKKQNIISEEHLSLIWQYKLFDGASLLGEKGERITIEFQGIKNCEEGPDFKDARVWINGRIYVGDVELHLYNSGWQSHRHSGNTSYRNVILHVSMWRDYSYCSIHNLDMPELILEPYLTVALPDLIRKTNMLSNEPLQNLDDEVLENMLDEAGDRRFKLKSDRFKQLLQTTDKDEVLYRGIAEALGYKNNKAQFLELAKIATYWELRAIDKVDVIGETLLYCGGFIDENLIASKLNRMDILLWRPHGRPANNPRSRIKSLAKIVYLTNDDGLTNYFSNRIATKAVADTFSSCGIGRERGLLILFNVILPFFYAYSDSSRNAIKRLYNAHSSISSNIITKNAGALLFGDRSVANLVANTVRRQMGLQQLYREKRF